MPALNWDSAVRILMILIAAYIVVTMPEALFPRVKRRFTHRSYAEKGLSFGPDAADENTAEAVMKAADARYGSRLDIRLTKDSVPVVFSDATLERAAGDNRRIADLTFEELSGIPMLGDRRIEKLIDITKAMEERKDRAPILLNLHPDRDPKEEKEAFCRSVTEAFYEQRYFCAVESDDLDVLSFYAKNYSNIVRGQVLYPKEESGLPEKEYNIRMQMLRNMKTRPQFYDLPMNCYNFALRVQGIMGAFFIIRYAETNEERATLKKTYGVESVVFREGRPDPEF